MGNVGEASLSKGVNTGTEREQPQKLSCARLRNSKRPGPAVGRAPAQCLSSTRSFQHHDKSMSQELLLYLFYIWKK